MLNLRLAECYYKILKLGEGQLVELAAGGTDALRGLLFESLESAVGYLESGPQQAKVLGMMDDLSHHECRQDLEER